MFGTINLENKNDKDDKDEQLTIILVDDREDSLFTIKALLEPLQVSILTVRTGLEAISLFEKFDFALAIIDVHMPNMSGLELATKMRSYPHLKDVPVIFLTTDPQEAYHIFLGHEYGPVDYLLKPVSPHILLSKVNVLLHLARKSVQLETAVKHLQESQGKMQTLLDCLGEGLLSIDLKGTVTSINKSGLTILNASVEDIVGKSIGLIFSDHVLCDESKKIVESCTHGKEISNEDCLLNKKRHGILHIEYHCTPLVGQNSVVLGGVLVFSDISERIKAKEEVVYLSKYDQLTKLPNRHMFQEQLTSAVRRATRYARGLAVLIVDVDNFKAINDSLTPQTGDEVLRVISRRIQESVREVDFVARFGADEFGVIIEDVRKSVDAARICEKLIEHMNKPLSVNGQIVPIMITIGIATFPQCNSPQDLMIAADTAVNQGKEHHRGTYCFFDPNLQIQTSRQLELIRDIRHALNHEEFHLYYQPQFRAKTHIPYGAESLIRWPRGKDIILPSEFIPLAEKFGLINAIGEWTLREACAQAKLWNSDPNIHTKLVVAVNVSVSQLKEGIFHTLITKVLEDTGLDPCCLEIEITEGIVISDPDGASKILKKIHDLGVRISIDDFGTGYSSLNYLRKLTIDTLKIDTSFVSGIGIDKTNESIIRSVIDLSHALNIHVVAEGVETMEQLSFLEGYNCDILQGFLFSEAMPGKAATGFLLNTFEQKYATHKDLFIPSDPSKLK